MDKQVKANIKLSWCDRHKQWWVINCPDCMAERVDEEWRDLGYRKLPKGLPPLLKPNNIAREWVMLLELVITSVKQGNKDRTEIALGKMATMAFEAQREADIKWYEGEE